MAEFEVVWRIDGIDAESLRGAARRVQDIMLEADSFEVFEVRETGSDGVFATVDLMGPGPFEHESTPGVWEAAYFEDAWNGTVSPVVSREIAAEVARDLNAEAYLCEDVTAVGWFSWDGDVLVYAQLGYGADRVEPDADGLYHLRELGFSTWREHEEA